MILSGNMADNYGRPIVAIMKLWWHTWVSCECISLQSHPYMEDLQLFFIQTRVHGLSYGLCSNIHCSKVFMYAVLWDYRWRHSH